MDRNQVIGISLISVMLVVYLFLQNEKAKNAPAPTPITQTASKTTTTDPIPQQSSAPDTAASNDTIQQALKTYIIENGDVRVFVSNKGATITKVALKKHKTFRYDTLVIFDESSNRYNWTLPTKSKGNVDLSNTVFNTDASDITVVKDTTKISFKHDFGNNQSITYTYVFAPNGYSIDQDIHLTGFENDLSTPKLTLYWNDRLKRYEKNVEESRNQATINYYTSDEEFNDVGVGNGIIEKKPETPIKWLAFKQRFFSTAIIATSTNFEQAALYTNTNPDDTTIIKVANATVQLPIKNHASLRYYFGPNDYDITKKVTPGFEKNVYLGWKVFSWVNEFVVLPVFRILERYISNYGLIILCLVLIIKTILFPIAYRSYLSMAKMRELKPELDAIKEQYPDNMAQVQQESMKLYQQVGVNPLSGCIPVLLQMPILLALFNFFPNCIELRQQAFLWAPDLSTYDDIIKLPFHIPAYGSHVSIFTLLMTLSTLAYTWYNNQINTTAQGPMKAVSYMMPVIFMFVLNSFSAGLTFYYFVSNILTIAQQLVATQFIDKDKIREAMENHKKTFGTKKKGTFTARLEEALKQSQEAKAATKNKKKD